MRRRLVGQPAKAFAFTKHREHLENARRSRASGQRGPQGLRHRAELGAMAVGEAAHRPLRGFDRPWLDRRQFGGHPAQERPGIRVEQAFGLLIELNWAAGPQKARALDEIEQRLGALLQAWHGGEPLAAQRRCHLAGELAAVGEMRQQPLDGVE